MSNGSSVLDGIVAVLLPVKEEELSGKDFALCESMIIYIEDHEEAPKPVDIMEMMQTDKLSEVYLELEHLQEIGVIGYAPKMPNPIVIVRGM